MEGEKKVFDHFGLSTFDAEVSQHNRNPYDLLFKTELRNSETERNINMTLNKLLNMQNITKVNKTKQMIKLNVLIHLK